MSAYFNLYRMPAYFNLWCGVHRRWCNVKSGSQMCLHCLCLHVSSHYCWYLHSLILYVTCIIGDIGILFCVYGHFKHKAVWQVSLWSSSCAFSTGSTNTLPGHSWTVAWLLWILLRYANTKFIILMRNPNFVGRLNCDLLHITLQADPTPTSTSVTPPVIATMLLYISTADSEITFTSPFVPMSTREYSNFFYSCGSNLNVRGVCPAPSNFVHAQWVP